MGLRRSNILITDALVVMSLPTRGRFIKPPQLMLWAREMGIKLSVSQASNMIHRAKGLIVQTPHGWTLTEVGALYRERVCEVIRAMHAQRPLDNRVTAS